MYLGNHAPNLFLGETALVVGDGDIILTAGGLDRGKLASISKLTDLSLRSTTEHGDTIELELANEVVVLSASMCGPET